MREALAEFVDADFVYGLKECNEYINIYMKGKIYGYNYD